MGRIICIYLVMTATAGSLYAEGDALILKSSTLLVGWDAEPASAVRLAAEAFRQVARDRAGVAVRIGGEAQADDYVLMVKQMTVTTSGPAADGFQMVTRPDASRRMTLSSATPSGFVAGFGHLMRLCRYGEGELTLPAVDVREVSAMPNRGIYFATHFGNFYHRAPLEEIDAVVRDLALWGTNQLIVWFDMHHFQSFDDPAAQEHLRRLRHLEKTAHSLGMQFGLVFIANEAYAGSPEPLRAKYKPLWAHFHVELCPSTPEGLALIGRGQEQVLRAFERVDIAWTWPYDQGGCACERCMPWGGNGFLRASRQLADIYRKVNPRGQFWLSTWLFDAFDEQGRSSLDRLLNEGGGDYEGLFRLMRDDAPPWFDGIIAGTHGDWIPEPLLHRPRPERYPLAAFPEISMYQMNPWGGCGANPLIGHCSKLAQALRGRIVGGWPYSEGIYEDLNKFYFARFFWAPDRPAEDIAREYAAYYFGPQVAEDAVRLFSLLEKTLPREGWQVRNLAEADEAFALVRSMEGRMPAWAKASWRWRIMRLRAEIDHLLNHEGRQSEEGRAGLRRAGEELTRIYHAKQAEPGLRPPVE